MTVAQILLSLALPLAFGLAPWVLTAVSTQAAAGVLAARLALAVAGSAIGGVPRAVSDLVLAVAGLGGGVALGRVLSLRPRVMALFLGLASIADIAQNALSGGAGPGSPGWSGAAAPSWQAYTARWVPLRGGHYDIGALDLLLFTAIGEHWLRRGGSPVNRPGRRTGHGPGRPGAIPGHPAADPVRVRRLAAHRRGHPARPPPAARQRALAVSPPGTACHIAPQAEHNRQPART